MVNNRYEDYTKYSKLFESKLIECDFLREQKITVEDIIYPLEDMIKEEFIKKFLDKGRMYFKKGGFKKLVAEITGGVAKFFKNFSLKNLRLGLNNYVKKLGIQASNWFKDKFSGLTPFIVKNNMVDQNNKPVVKNIWKVLCEKVKGLVDWEKEGVNPSQLQSVGDKIKLNEAESKYDISDQEVKYYGFFEKVVHAMGIKNARFNGVVSQIMKKGTYGLAIMGIMKLAGFSFAALTAGLSLGPVATAAIGGMLLMAGLIILAIWICRPYPTLDDCLSYLHIAFGNRLQKVKMVSIFTVTVNIVQDVEISGGKKGGGEYKDKDKEKPNDISKKDLEEAKPLKSLYPTMISNLASLKSLLSSYESIDLEGEKVKKEESGETKNKEEEPIIEPGQTEIQVVPGVKLVNLRTVPDQETIDKDYELAPSEVRMLGGEEGMDDKLKKRYIELRNIWKGEQKREGKNTKPGQGTRKRLMRLAKIRVEYDKLEKTWKIGQQKAGKNQRPGPGTRSRLMRQATEKVVGQKESRIFNFYQFNPIYEEKTVGVTSEESHMTQSVQKIRKSIKNLKDEKDKGVGITIQFLDAILQQESQPETEKAIKSLFTSIYSYLYGKNKATLPLPEKLYKESVEVLQNRSKGQVVAEKISRFALRAMQFEGENLYGGLGEFGTDLKDYNKSLKEIMASMKQGEMMELPKPIGQGKPPFLQEESFRYLQKFNKL